MNILMAIENNLYSAVLSLIFVRN